ncbi:hypothetical protein ACRC7T_00035 [Segnochrobactraceae bacterium EtOH-i3]
MIAAETSPYSTNVQPTFAFTAYHTASSLKVLPVRKPVFEFGGTICSASTRPIVQKMAGGNSSRYFIYLSKMINSSSVPHNIHLLSGTSGQLPLTIVAEIHDIIRRLEQKSITP